MLCSLSLSLYKRSSLKMHAFDERERSRVGEQGLRPSPLLFAGLNDGKASRVWHRAEGGGGWRDSLCMFYALSTGRPLRSVGRQVGRHRRARAIAGLPTLSSRPPRYTIGSFRFSYFFASASAPHLSHSFCSRPKDSFLLYPPPSSSLELRPPPPLFSVPLLASFLAGKLEGPCPFLLRPTEAGFLLSTPVPPSKNILPSLPCANVRPPEQRTNERTNERKTTLNFLLPLSSFDRAVLPLPPFPPPPAAHVAPSSFFGTSER